MARLHLLCLVFLSGITYLQARIVHATGGQHYVLTYWGAHQQCAELGGSLANPNDLEQARQNGSSMCSCGWLADKTARYPMTTSLPQCGGRPGVHRCGWRKKWNAYCFIEDEVGNCSIPLGMESGAIKNSQLTSLTAEHAIWGEKWTADRARLNKKGIVNAWMPHHDGRNQFIEVDLEKPTAITGIVTQGARRYLRNQYIKRFKIAFSKNGHLWAYCTNENGADVIFSGNTDNETHVRNMFPEAILAQYIRIFPYEWERHITLRFELLGCDLKTYDLAREKRREEEDRRVILRRGSGATPHK